MQKTEKIHWVNGHRVFGGWFHTFAFRVFNYAFMFVWGVNPHYSHKKVAYIKSYKLI